MLLTAPTRTERWLVSLALLLIYAVVLLAVGLAGAVLGVRYGVLPGPTLHLQLGPVQVVALTSASPDCNPAATNCPRPNPAAPRYYTLWVVTTQKVAGPGSAQEQFGGARVFALQAGP